MQQLETFFWTVTLGSFSAAAEKLYATQSAVSMRVRELERTLGVELFDRTHRTARLTPKGRELARKWGVRFLVVNPTCVSDNGKLERPPQLGTPLFVSDKLVVMKLVGGSS